MGGSKRRRLRRWVLALAVAAGMVAVAAAAVKVWIAPAAIQWQIRGFLSQFFRGTVCVGGIDFRFFGPIRIGRVRLTDAAGRTWVQIGPTEVALDRWPGRVPTIKRVHVEGLEMRLHFEDGRCRLPVIRWPTREDLRWILDHWDAEQFSIQETCAAMHDEAGAEVTRENFGVLWRRKGDAYELEAARRPSSPSESFLLRGDIPAGAGQADLALTLRRAFEQDETAGVIRTLRVPALSWGRGEVSASLRVRGDLGDPLAMTPFGQIRLAEWTLALCGGETIRGIGATIDVDRDEKITLTSRDLQAELCGGQVTGWTRVAIDPRSGRQPLSYQADLLARTVALPRLTLAVMGEQPLGTGHLSARLEIDGSGTGLDGLRVRRGLVHVEDADVQNLPLARKLLSFLPLDPGSVAGGSELQAVITMRGPVVRIQQARLAGRLWAFDAEPGGTINLRTREMDFYVVGAPLKDLKDLLAALPNPLLAIPADLANKLTRVHVRGQWTDPADELIRKEPLRDLAEGTKEFLQQLVGPGRGLGERLFQGLGGLTKTPPDPASRTAEQKPQGDGARP